MTSKYVNPTTYAFGEISVANGANNQALDLTTLGINTIVSAQYFQIINLATAGSGDDISFKMNSTSNISLTLRAGEGFQENQMEVRSIYVSNASGSAVSIKYYLTGQATLN